MLSIESANYPPEVTALSNVDREHVWLIWVGGLLAVMVLFVHLPYVATTGVNRPFFFSPYIHDVRAGAHDPGDSTYGGRFVFGADPPFPLSLLNACRGEAQIFVYLALIFHGALGIVAVLWALGKETAYRRTWQTLTVVGLYDILAHQAYVWAFDGVDLGVYSVF